MPDWTGSWAGYREDWNTYECIMYMHGGRYNIYKIGRMLFSRSAISKRQENKI